MTDQKTEQKTLRDEFAMAALSGALANKRTKHIEDICSEGMSILSEYCYELADAMLAARTQEAK